MKIYIFAKKINSAKKEAERIAKEHGGKIHFSEGLFIVEYHAPAGESGPADYKDTGSPEPGLKNTAEVIE